MTAPASADDASSNEHTCSLNFTAETIDGETVDLHDYEGKVVLIVNVASKCGYTKQYAGLQDLYEKYKDKGLVILGFPSNEFRGQEPGTNAEIKEFCTSKFGVTFPMMSKVEVNTPEACALYKHLTSQDAKPLGKGPVAWNFEKFLIGRDGQVVNRFGSKTKPSDEELITAIEAQLSSKG
ncbi:glutathione peroxidase [Rhodopirellula sp. ICT_H3.1]|uniref:Glutathione peroxidase n=1 Tax=Aporhodopirellula aestuarii TaxID=2950107 RepID=A0ABT0U158_9BACT|nr:glutathione peroxidase [Aporhodopirellula aestuarii]MCM2370603.1 glutathione peroxidase [Aporhodopirellula aestuarii]